MYFAGDLKSEDILPVLREAADFVLSYEGEIPGYSPRDCGNYLDNNLNLAKIYMRKFKQEVLDNPAPERLVVSAVDNSTRQNGYLIRSD